VRNQLEIEGQILTRQGVITIKRHSRTRDVGHRERDGRAVLLSVLEALADRGLDAGRQYAALYLEDQILAVRAIGSMAPSYRAPRVVRVGETARRSYFSNPQFAITITGNIPPSLMMLTNPICTPLARSA
jgi:hypothetical protein